MVRMGTDTGPAAKPRYHWLGLLAALACGIALLSAPAAADQLRDAQTAYHQARYKKSFNLYKPLAVAGSPDAQYMLGRHYQFGQGVNKDLVHAYAWYARAEKKGHDEAGLFRVLLVKKWGMTAAQVKRAQALAKLPLRSGGREVARAPDPDSLNRPPNPRGAAKNPPVAETKPPRTKTDGVTTEKDLAGDQPPRKTPKTPGVAGKKKPVTPKIAEGPPLDPKTPDAGPGKKPEPKKIAPKKEDPVVRPRRDIVKTPPAPKPKPKTEAKADARAPGLDREPRVPNANNRAPIREEAGLPPRERRNGTDYDRTEDRPAWTPPVAPRWRDPRWRDPRWRDPRWRAQRWRARQWRQEQRWRNRRWQARQWQDQRVRRGPYWTPPRNRQARRWQTYPERPSYDRPYRNSYRPSAVIRRTGRLVRRILRPWDY